MTPDKTLVHVLIGALVVSQGRVAALNLLRAYLRLRQDPNVVSVGLQRLLFLLVVCDVASKEAGDATVTTLGEAVEDILLRQNQVRTE